MKRRGPRTKWHRIIRETVLEILIGAAIGLKILGDCRENGL